MTVAFRIDSTSTVTSLPNAYEQKMFERLLEDSLSLSTLSLLENPIANSEIEERQVNIILSNEDRDLFLESLKNPPQPNKKLKDLFGYYYEKMMEE